jgi:FlaA1/EpsC-like NDP-sugar epimerase
LKTAFPHHIVRNRLFLLLDLLLLGPLPFVLVALRYEGSTWPPAVVQATMAYAAIALLLRIAVAYGSGLYRTLWQYASIVELERLIYAGTVAGAMTFIAGAVLIRGLGLAPVRMPYSTLLNDAMWAFALLTAPRITSRMLNRGPRGRTAVGKRVLIAGAGKLGQAILRETRVGPLNVWPIGFVDDNPLKQGQLLGGVPILGPLAQIPQLVREYQIDEVIIAIASVRGSAVRGIVQSLTGSGVNVRIVPGIGQLITGEVRVSDLRPVEIEDLLRREPVITDMAAVRSFAEGKVVLVTGAGGSIGSELCRQIAALAPAALIALDHSENLIFEIQNELKKRAPSLKFIPVIANIRDAGRIRSIINRHAPYAIFHAAAHKHVPLMEENIVEAITNNILGTRNVVDAALDSECAIMVNISTDKAVRPTSVMGASKRVAEQIVAHAAKSEQRNFVSVRFGNVLGSRGSVVPTFLSQIRAGGPVTITHPEMRRYFMTIPEAVQLVLQAGALGKGGDLFVLDMGEPVKIADLARDLIRLSGLEEGADIDITYTGVRPGEKLYEEVFFSGEDVRPTAHPKVLRATGDAIERGFMESVDRLIRKAYSEPIDDRALRDSVRDLVPDFAVEDARTNPRTRPSPPTIRSDSVLGGTARNLDPLPDV